MQATATQHNACTTLSIRLASVSAKHASLKMNQAQNNRDFQSKANVYFGQKLLCRLQKKTFFSARVEIYYGNGKHVSIFSSHARCTYCPI